MPPALFHFGRVMLNPTVERRVIHIKTTFQHHFRQITIADPVFQYHRTTQNHLPTKMTPFEIDIEATLKNTMVHLASYFLQQSQKTKASLL